jgi:hypothetical protein
MGANEESYKELKLVRYLKKHDDRDWEPLGQNPGVCAIESGQWESRISVIELCCDGPYYAKRDGETTDHYEDPLDALEELDDDE